MLMDVECTTLTNGLRVVTSSLPHVESVTFGIWIGAGGRHESNRQAGMSHFIEHLLFKGTKKRSAKDITVAIEGRGGYLNAFTQEENTCYYARVAYDKLWYALEVLTDMYLNASLPPDELEKERGVIIEEIMMYKDQPQHMVQEILTDALWKNHPLGRPIIGFPKTVAAMTRRDISEYRARMYVPCNTIFAFAGKVNHTECVRKVRELVKRPSGTSLRRERPASSRVKQRTLALQTKDIEQSHLAMGIRIFGKNDRRRYPLRLLNTVLGENMSSRLFQVVREQHGLAYSVHSSFQLYKETGALVVSAGLDRKRHDKAFSLIIKELNRLKRRPVGSRELKRAKDYVIGQLRLGMESTTYQMMWLGENIMSYGRVILPSETIKIISKITASDIRDLAETIIKGAKTSVAMISPDLSGKDETRIRKELSSL
ncbi:MAG: insulinase family protein [Lentisphaerae bacterium]|nr:insulinase family protein [Lentisphaerota bacterium]